EVRNKYIELFTDGHSLATALYAYEDNLYLCANHDQELMQLLADCAQNPDYGYVLNLFKQYHNEYLGGTNGKSMFQRLTHEVNTYNNSGKGYAVFQEYDSQAGKAFILCIVTNLMIRVHEKIRQSGEICYVDALASFEPLNISITLLYTSCISEALPLGLLVTSNELEATLKRGLSLLKTLLPQYAFFGRGPNVGPMVFLTDDSSAERNAL
ncbi:34074_t:CDS:1, partial [Gigaspora margarita]